MAQKMLNEFIPLRAMVERTSEAQGIVTKYTYIDTAGRSMFLRTVNRLRRNTTAPAAGCPGFDSSCDRLQRWNQSINHTPLTDALVDHGCRQLRSANLRTSAAILGLQPLRRQDVLRLQPHFIWKVECWAESSFSKFLCFSVASQSIVTNC